MQRKEFIAVVGTVLLIGVLTAALNQAVQVFNPTPGTRTFVTTSFCAPTALVCPSFTVDFASLVVHRVGDVTSQVLTVRISVHGASTLSEMNATLSGVPIGNQNATGTGGSSITVTFGIPTTASLVPGQSYAVLLEGLFTRGSAGSAVETYWQGFHVTAEQS